MKSIPESECQHRFNPDDTETFNKAMEKTTTKTKCYFETPNYKTMP